MSPDFNETLRIEWCRKYDCIVYPIYLLKKTQPDL